MEQEAMYQVKNTDQPLQKSSQCLAMAQCDK
jgi:hypothetical protein